MKIEAITLREIQMPLVHFFETSFGRTTGRRIILVTVHGEGVEGWGECVAGEHPHYSDESVDTAWYTLVKYFAPALVGKSIASGREAPKYFSRIRGHRMAKGALENAIWDAEAIAKNIPLWKLLRGVQTELNCGVSIGIQDSPDKLVEKVRTELNAGYQRIKLKVKPGWDVAILERIRREWPDILLSVDANSAYTTDDFDHLKEFDRFNLLMIEQPLWNDDFYFHHKLQKQIKTAICLDEVIRSARDAQAAAELGACRIVNVKVGRVGGFTEAIKVHDVCRQHNIANWCGGMLEAGIGRSHNIALSTLPNFTLPGDVSASKRYWKEDIIEPEVTVSPKGTITVTDKPGRGYDLKPDLIEKLTVRKEVVKGSTVGA
ncbi:MAG TPA: o-succinylbenzoate synthase [Terriglobales bacterium]|nr:o-succinylbenzoate synthase [Terriglobales bacterium]